MTYHLGKAQKKSRYIKYGFFSFAFIFVIMFWPVIRKTLYPVIEPVVFGYGSTKQSFIVFPEFFRTYLSSHKKLAERQKVLEIEIERLENKIVEQEALLKEYDLIKSSVQEGEFRTSSPVVLYPLMQDYTKLYSTILLSKGFKDGITIGDTVFIRGNQAVCTIKEIYTSSSLCTLLTASGVTTEGVTGSSSVTLIGRGGHYLANVVRDTPITKGDIVYLRSNPKMVLGVVKEVSHNNQDTSWHLFVEGAYNPVTSSIFYVQP